MISHLPKGDLMDRLTALDYEFAGGPTVGTLSDWRGGITNNDQKAREFIRRISGLADDANAPLTAGQRADALQLGVANLLATLEREGF